MPVSSDVGHYASGDRDGRSPGTGHTNLADINITLVRMESKLDAFRQDINYMREAQMQRTQDNERRFNDFEGRVRVLEASKIDPQRLHEIESKRYLEAKSVTAVAAILLPMIAIGVSIIAIVVK